MTEQEQIKYIGLDRLNALDKVGVILGGDFQLTGSISLFEYGVVKREIKDIDIVVPSLDTVKILFDKKGMDFTEWSDYSDTKENAANTSQKKGRVTNRVSFKIDGFSFCAFLGINQRFKTVEYLAGRSFKVSDPEYSIERKKKYLIELLQKDSLTQKQIYSFNKHSGDVGAYYERRVGDGYFLPF